MKVEVKFTETEQVMDSQFDETNQSFDADFGEMTGIGKGGVDGKSAYEIAVDNGFEGNETEWLASLQGEDGYTPIKGVDYFDGKDGADGKDGYTPVKGVDYFDGKDGERGVSGVYVGSGDMPEGYNVQIDPNGSATDIIDMVLAALPVYGGEVEFV